MTKSIANVLNNLIQISINGEKGFINAADHIQNENLKSIFLQKSENSKLAALELQQILLSLDEKPEEDGTLAGVISRGWMDIKSMVTSHDNYAILAECERCEDIAKAAYENALKEDLPSEILVVIRKQCQNVIADHDQIRDLRNQYAEKA